MRGMKAIFVAVAMVCGLGLASGPAYAESSVRVSLTDLDLTQTEQVDEALARLTRAAKQVCADEPPALAVFSRVQMRRCVAATMRDVVARIASPDLETRYAEGRRARAQRLAMS